MTVVAKTHDQFITVVHRVSKGWVDFVSDAIDSTPPQEILDPVDNAAEDRNQRDHF
jgi:hypothetical protein